MMLNISKNIYFGWDASGGKYELPEAAVIPLGDSANEKRKIDGAARKYSRLQDHENIPLPGFTLHKTDKKNYGSVDQTWLVIDPRGFMVRITSYNLEQILHVTGITEGLIQEKCIWARENTETKMTLIPVSSKSYVEAVRNTELIEGKVSLKDVSIGDTVLLQNKLQGTYMGVISLYGSLLESFSNTLTPQIFLRRQVIEVSPGRYHYQSDVKILKILKKSDAPWTREESVKKITEQIQKGNSFFSSNSDMTGRYYGVHGKIMHVSLTAAPKVNIMFEEVSKSDAETLFYESMTGTTGDIGMLLLEDAGNERYLVDHPYIWSSPGTFTSPHSFEICRLKPFDINGVTKLSLYERRNSQMFNSTKKILLSLDNFVKFYKIVKYVKNETYV